MKAANRATHLVIVLFATTCCIAFFAFRKGVITPQKYFPKSDSTACASNTPAPGKRCVPGYEYCMDQLEKAMQHLEMATAGSEQQKMEAAIAGARVKLQVGLRQSN